MKTFTILVERRGKEKEVTGTLEYLRNYFGYTLEVGYSWQHERGNYKINKNPRTAKSLVNNLNNSAYNSSANGDPSVYYELVQ